jgi:hypothetical protein
MLFASWITKAKNAHPEYVTLTAFALQQWVQEHATILRLYMYCLSCLKMSAVQTWLLSRANLWVRQGVAQYLAG